MQLISPSSPSPLLSVEDLKTYFFTEEGTAPAVNGVSFTLAPGEAFGLVGESGCGKSVTALSIMRLVSEPPGRIISGRVFFEGRDLLSLEKEAMRRMRGRRMAMIFQEPMTSLNPVIPIGDQIAESLDLHLGHELSAGAIRDRTRELLRQVRIPAPDQRLRQYPHQLSGGLRQRVMIAMALSCGPDLLIADEPTTALDVTIQAQILRLIRELRQAAGLSLLLITHNLRVVAETCRRVAVMYAGRIVELAAVQDLFADPLHPYTRGLLASLPRAGGEAKTRLPVIPGRVPDLTDLPAGCAFQDRCHWGLGRCREDPELKDAGGGHLVRCWKYEGSWNP
ncbi:MAG: ABC transporter ATP-binding protein [Desulfobacterota bacterium]|nr:ABC transporter ATP-binding protein [Thermodesulfobacteriota bacterium]